MLITCIQVHWLLEAESMDALKAFPLVFDLLRVGEVRESKATVVELGAWMLLPACTKLIEIWHGVRLRHFLLRELIQVGLDEWAILTALATFCASIVIESSGDCCFLLWERGCIVGVQLVGGGVFAALRLLWCVVSEARCVLIGSFLWFNFVFDQYLCHFSKLSG